MSANIDTFICGTCHLCFYDLSLFVGHKNANLCREAPIDAENGEDSPYNGQSEVREEIEEEGGEVAVFQGEGAVFQGGSAANKTNNVYAFESEDMQQQEEGGEGKPARMIEEETERCSELIGGETGDGETTQDISLLQVQTLVDDDTDQGVAQIFQVCVDGRNIQGVAQLDPATGMYYITEEFSLVDDAGGRVPGLAEDSQAYMVDLCQQTSPSDQKGCRGGLSDVQERRGQSDVKGCRKGQGEGLKLGKDAIATVGGGVSCDTELAGIELVPVGSGQVAESACDWSALHHGTLQIVVKSVRPLPLAEPAAVDANQNNSSETGGKPVRKRGRPKLSDEDKNLRQSPRAKVAKETEERRAVVDLGPSGKIACARCRKSFTRARHYNSHRCLAEGDYVDPTNWPVKNEVVSDHDDDEGNDASYRPDVDLDDKKEPEEEEDCDAGLIRRAANFLRPSPRAAAPPPDQSRLADSSLLHHRYKGVSTAPRKVLLINRNSGGIESNPGVGKSIDSNSVSQNLGNGCNSDTKANSVVDFLPKGSLAEGRTRWKDDAMETSSLVRFDPCSKDADGDCRDIGHVDDDREEIGERLRSLQTAVAIEAEALQRIIATECIVMGAEDSVLATDEVATTMDDVATGRSLTERTACDAERGNDDEKNVVFSERNVRSFASENVKHTPQEDESDGADFTLHKQNMTSAGNPTDNPTQSDSDAIVHYFVDTEGILAEELTDVLHSARGESGWVDVDSSSGNTSADRPRKKQRLEKSPENGENLINDTSTKGVPPTYQTSEGYLATIENASDTATENICEDTLTMQNSYGSATVCDFSTENVAADDAADATDEGLATNNSPADNLIVEAVADESSDNPYGPNHPKRGDKPTGRSVQSKQKKDDRMVADRNALDRSLDVDLSPLVDDMYRTHMIAQNENENAVRSARGPRHARPLLVYTCNECEKVFMSLSHVRLHCVTHTDARPFRCHRCSFSSNTKGNLYTHMRRHTGSLYRCSACPFKTANRTHLVDHELTHFGPRPSCELCDRTYNTPKSLANHVRAHHTGPEGIAYFRRLKVIVIGQGPSKRRSLAVLHQCQVCNRKFKDKEKRDRHTLVHNHAYEHNHAHTHALQHNHALETLQANGEDEEEEESLTVAGQLDNVELTELTDAQGTGDDDDFVEEENREELKMLQLQFGAGV